MMDLVMRPLVTLDKSCFSEVIGRERLFGMSSSKNRREVRDST